VTAGTTLIVVLTAQMANAVRDPRASTISGLVTAMILLLLLGPLARRRHWGHRV